MCGLHKAGGSPLSPQAIIMYDLKLKFFVLNLVARASKIATTKVQDLTLSIQTALSQDALKRKNLKGKPLDKYASSQIIHRYRLLTFSHFGKYFELMNAGVLMSEIAPMMTTNNTNDIIDEAQSENAGNDS